MTRALRLAGVALAVTLAYSAASPPAIHAGAGDAKGTLTHKGKTVTLKHAYLVTGPDAVDPKKSIRRVILSAKELGATVRGCQVMSCADSQLMEGLVVDFVGGPRLNYWMTVNDQRVQHSATKPPSVLKASADEPKRVAGKLVFDDTASGGPKVDVEFDAALVKEFKAAR